MRRFLILLLLFSCRSDKGSVRTELKEDGITRLFIIENVREIMGVSVQERETNEYIWVMNCNYKPANHLVVVYGEPVGGCGYSPFYSITYPKPPKLEKGKEYRFSYMSTSAHIPSRFVWFVH